MCTYSPEIQSYPGLHQKNCDQQVEGGDSPPLFCSHETTLGVLRPALRSSLQERQGPVRVSLDKGHKNDLWAGTAVL